jgi:hypothetical protein
VALTVCGSVCPADLKNTIRRMPAGIASAAAAAAVDAAGAAVDAMDLVQQSDHGFRGIRRAKVRDALCASWAHTAHALALHSFRSLLTANRCTTRDRMWLETECGVPNMAGAHSSR